MCSASRTLLSGTAFDATSSQRGFTGTFTQATFTGATVTGPVVGQFKGDFYGPTANAIGGTFAAGVNVTPTGASTSTNLQYNGIFSGKQ